MKVWEVCLCYESESNFIKNMLKKIVQQQQK